MSKQKRNVEFEVCYYAIGTLKCHCKCVTVEVSTHKGSMTFEDFNHFSRILSRIF